MFGNYYRSNNNMFYIGLLVGGVVGMYTARWFFSPKNEKNDFENDSIGSEVASKIDEKINKMDDKAKEIMFNSFINLNKDEHDLYDEFSKTDLTN